MHKTTDLKRVISLPLIIFYGLGNILGAGIYVLIGKVAGYGGYYSALAFFIASLVAAVSAFTYAELSSRYPKSAGEAVYIQKALKIAPLSLFIGLLIIFAGCVSSGAIALGFAGYTRVFIDIPISLILLILISLLGAIACWGIRFSVGIASLITVIEIIGLIIIISVAWSPVTETQTTVENLPALDLVMMQGIFLGAFLAFYAYIGFEDMVNISEEVVNSEKNMPIAILAALVIATILYSLVAYVCVFAVDPAQLSQSDAPLALVYEEATGRKPVLITVISLFAVINGALIQIIMASRILYGVSRQGWLPEFLGAVNARTHTPVNATVICCALILVLSLWLPVETLARATSYLILIIFSLMNLSLIIIKLREQAATKHFAVPLWVPILGITLSAGFILLQLTISLSVL